jgi:hypothetical protein
VPSICVACSARRLIVDTLARVIALTDHVRLPVPRDANADWSKEWYHFCIIGPRIQAIVNLSLTYDTWSAASPGERVARVILLVREGTWDGGVDTIPFRDVQAHRGHVNLRFGQNSVCFQDGVFRLSIALESRPITLVLKLRPIAYPLLRRNTPLGAGMINWLVVPRLSATGTITVGKCVHELHEVPAYHDHNWGHWLWGHDFAWQWGFALPDGADMPWGVVFDQMTNRARTETAELKLSLWKHDTLHRLFLHEEIAVQRAGYLPPGRVPKFPPVMALLAPERTTGVPRYLEVTAATGDDHLRCRFEAQDAAQLIIPNETDLGVTIINEVGGRLELEGQVKGEPVALEGKGFFEFFT